MGICLGGLRGVVTHVKGTILAVGVLSVLDALTTLVGIQRGMFFEANPLLATALAVHPGWFLLAKGGLTLFWMGIMLREAHRPWLAFLNFGIALAYTFVVLRSLFHLILS